MPRKLFMDHDENQDVGKTFSKRFIRSINEKHFTHDVRDRVFRSFLFFLVFFILLPFWIVRNHYVP